MNQEPLYRDSCKSKKRLITQTGANFPSFFMCGGELQLIGDAHQGTKNISASRSVRTGEATKPGAKPKML